LVDDPVRTLNLGGTSDNPNDQYVASIWADENRNIRRICCRRRLHLFLRSLRINSLFFVGDDVDIHRRGLLQKAVNSGKV